MTQVKIYGLRSSLAARKAALSDAIHAALMASFGLPSEKRFQRFILFERDEFLFPADRSDNYTILEISMFEGRSPKAKRQLIMHLFSAIAEQVGIAPHDLEITLIETPRANWGIRGQPGDELALNYKVDV